MYMDLVWMFMYIYNIYIYINILIINIQTNQIHALYACQNNVELTTLGFELLELIYDSSRAFEGGMVGDSSFFLGWLRGIILEELVIQTWGWVKTYYHYISGKNSSFTNYFRVPGVLGFWLIAKYPSKYHPQATG